jgi:hypothetical protein
MLDIVDRNSSSALPAGARLLDHIPMRRRAGEPCAECMARQQSFAISAFHGVEFAQLRAMRRAHGSRSQISAYCKRPSPPSSAKRRGRWTRSGRREHGAEPLLARRLMQWVAGFDFRRSPAGHGVHRSDSLCRWMSSGVSGQWKHLQFVIPAFAVRHSHLQRITRQSPRPACGERVRVRGRATRVRSSQTEA